MKSERFLGLLSCNSEKPSEALAMSRFWVAREAKDGSVIDFPRPKRIEGGKR